MSKLVRRFFYLSFIFSLLFELVGCTTYTVMGQTTDKRISCSNTRVLLTDLTQPTQQRHYFLPDTTPCHNIVLR